MVRLEGEHSDRRSVIVTHCAVTGGDRERRQVTGGEITKLRQADKCQMMNHKHKNSLRKLKQYMITKTQILRV